MPANWNVCAILDPAAYLVRSILKYNDPAGKKHVSSPSRNDMLSCMESREPSENLNTPSPITPAITDM